MLYFEFNVYGWTNTQFLKADSETEAFEAAIKIASNEHNIFGFRKITRGEVNGILQDVKNI